MVSDFNQNKALCYLLNHTQFGKMKMYAERRSTRLLLKRSTGSLRGPGAVSIAVIIYYRRKKEARKEARGGRGGGRRGEKEQEERRRG